KLFTLLVLSCICLAASAQTIHPDYKDGKLYVRVYANQNPSFGKIKKWKTLPLSSFPFIKNISPAFSITSISKPFFAAKGSDELLRTYELNFSNYAAVEQLIDALKQSGSVELAERIPIMRTSLTPNDYTPTG